jgi:hypothetical protein
MEGSGFAPPSSYPGRRRAMSQPDVAAPRTMHTGGKQDAPLVVVAAALHNNARVLPHWILQVR